MKSFAMQVLTFRAFRKTILDTTNKLNCNEQMKTTSWSDNVACYFLIMCMKLNNFHRGSD